MVEVSYAYLIVVLLKLQLFWMQEEKAMVEKICEPTVFFEVQRNDILGNRWEN